ncbi:MAG: pilin [Casimicrobium sp.]
MKTWLIALIAVIAIGILAHFTQWFGFTKPAIEAVRTEANAKIAATNARVDDNEKRAAAVETTVSAQGKKIETLDARTTAVENTVQTQGAKIDTLGARATAAENANQVQDKKIDALQQQTAANTQDLKEMKAHIASGGQKTAAEMQLERDLADTMARLSEVKVAFAESTATEARMPTSNAQAGLQAPEKFAAGALKRIAIENGAIVAYFDAQNPNPNPRLRLVPSDASPDFSQPIRWRCQTNMPVASRMFSTCDLKTTL